MTFDFSVSLKINRFRAEFRIASDRVKIGMAWVVERTRYVAVDGFWYQDGHETWIGLAPFGVRKAVVYTSGPHRTKHW